uniref:Uncharacterized protein n=1 Tax=Tanacetum cinerariifolium TaxID=118510 RepID=A0A6L2LYP2_TANCI|nr:hypothetical protein [Tanacetum cinerariifolium]
MTNDSRVKIVLSGGQDKLRVKMKVLSFLTKEAQLAHHHFECSSCGALYTTDYCCSDGSLGDKIIYDLNKTHDLSQRPSLNCPKCGNPIDGHYCQGCALLRKKFKEDLFTCCIENGILQDVSKPSNDNTNVVNALQEPFVVKQNPGKNSSQSPPQINHHCCYGCGDLLEDIFCHQCTLELCGKGAHYGYNCSRKVLIVPNLEPFNNQTIDGLPQTMPSFDPTCYSGDGNSFTYDSTSNLVDDSPNFFDHPSQPPLYFCEFCGNDARYGHYCTPQVPFIYPEPCYNQYFNFPQDFHDFQQQYLCCENCGGPHEAYQCALLRKKFKEYLFICCIENGILQDVSKPSNDNTNVVNALQEPFVVKQNPGKNSSQSPPQINHHCCYGCGDLLEDIFCHQCTLELYGKGAHYGYNCPRKVPIVPTPEPFNNQTIDELPQTMPNFDPTCYSGDGNSFTYDSISNLVDDSPNFFDHPSQPPLYFCEFCGNDARYGHYCTPQVPFIYPKPCYNQDINFPQDFHDFQQQYLCCKNCGGPHEAYQCQPMNEDYYHEQNACYDPNSFGFDQFQTPHSTINHPIFNA